MTLATVIIDPPTTLFAGGILALISWKLVKTSVGEVWRVGQLSAAWGLVYGLSVGWHFFFRPDWMFFYALDTAGLPLGPAFAGFLFVCTTWGALGGLGVAALIHVKEGALAVAAFLGALGGFVLLLLVTLDQYVHVGTRAEYLAGTAKKVQEDASWVTASNGSTALFLLAAAVIIAVQVKRIRAS